MFKEFKKVEPTCKPNLWNLPYNYLYSDDIDKFNKIYNAVKGWRELKRSSSGGISDKNFYYPSYYLDIGSNSIELIVCGKEGFFRLVFFPRKKYEANNEEIKGNDAFKEFDKICKKFKINLNRYKIKNGYEIKKQIEKPMIYLEHNLYQGIVFENAHHLDISSAWPAALVRMRPEFAPVINYIFQKKKELKDNGVKGSNNIYKAILNFAIGYMQSFKAYHRAAWAHLSRDAINENNRYMRELAEMLKKSGRRVLAYNTDGIWYTGKPFEGENQGKGLGQWDNDHINCKIRFKSAGSYEYIENGEYFPVVRGQTKLDKEGVPRNEWKWGDIFTEDGKETLFTFIKGVGIIEEGENYELQEII